MDYKQTLNLPATDFPMKANLVQKEPEMLEGWEEMDLYASSASLPWPQALYSPRRPPLRQRPYPHGHRLQQNPEGHHHQVQTDGRVRRALCSGLGLPRPAHRTSRWKGTRARKSTRCLRLEIRRYCRNYAEKYIDIQREEFKRLGVWASGKIPISP